MSCVKLNTNLYKTEFIGLKHQRGGTTAYFHVSINGSLISYTLMIRNFSELFDYGFSSSSHVQCLCRSLYIPSTKGE